MGDGSENDFEVEYEALTQARPVKTNGAVEILLGKQGEDSADEYTLIAQHIKNMRGSGATISERRKNGAEGERPIAYGDIAILIRSRRHLPDIENALLEADIPHLTTGGVGFYQRQEIYDIWNYLNFLNEANRKPNISCCHPPQSRFRYLRHRTLRNFTTGSDKFLGQSAEIPNTL